MGGEILKNPQSRAPLLFGIRVSITRT